MPAPTQPFALPENLPSTLAPIYEYWKTLIRGENTMPFSDDVNLSQLSELSDNLILVDVFAEPQRFRFNYLGKQLVRQLGSNIKDRFADELGASQSARLFCCSIERHRRSPSTHLVLLQPRKFERRSHDGLLAHSASDVGQWPDRATAWRHHLIIVLPIPTRPKPPASRYCFGTDQCAHSPCGPC